MATAGNIIGKVAVLQGQAFARAKDGTQRKLKVGDAVFENEVIVTAENSRVELEFDNGKVFLLRARETVTLDSAVIGSELPENRNAALLDRVGELADITRAIAEGSSLDQLLEETAAGLTGGGRDDGGHGFVQLLRIAEALDPAGFNYRFNPNDLSFELPPGGGVPDGVPIPASAPAPLPPAPGGNLAPTAVAASVLGAEDAASIPVSLSAADADGSIVSYTIASLPANGTLYADAAHTIVVSAGDTVVGPALFFVPNPNWNGTTNFTFTATDNNGAASNLASVNVTVNPANDPTVVTGGTSGAGNEDAVAITGTLTATDADGLADGTVFTVTGAAANGTASINPASGAWSYTPNADYNGIDSFTVTITDDAGNTTTQAISLTVGAVADIVADALTTNEDTAITANVITGTNGATADTFEGAPALTGVTNGANGTVTFTAAGNVTYTPNSNFSGADTFTYTVTSGGVSETTSVNVTVNPANDVPTLDLDASAAGTGYVTAFNADTGSPVSVADIDISVLDPDMVITGATITLTNAQTGDSFVAGTLPVGITASIAGNAVTLSGSSTPANYQAAIRAINFDTTSTNALARSITVSVTDGAATSNVATTTISILGTTDAPVLDLDANDSSGATTTSYQGRFTVGAGAVAIADTDVQITNNGTTINSATITLTNAQAGDVLGWGALPGGIIASLAGNVLTLSGITSLANYQTAIRAVTFNNSSGSPSLTDRTINVVVSDGTNSNTAVATIGINRAPTIDLDANDSTTTGNNYLTTYTDGAGAVALSDVDISVADADGVLMGASITLTNPKAGDVLAVGTMPAGITATVAGNTVSLSGAATPADYQTAIHAITFNNTSGTPDTTPRTIAVSVTDGAVTSNTATATISVVEVNSAPVLDLDASVAGSDYATFYSTVTRPDVPVSDTDVSVTDADSINITGATITLTNAQTGDVLIAGSMPPGITASVAGNVVTLSGSTFITDYQAAIRAISFNTTSSDLTARTITVTVTDGTSSSNTATTTITMVPANNPPVADTIAASGNEDALIPVILSGTDSDGTVTAFSLSTLPASGQLYLDAAMTQTVPTGTQLAASGSLTLYFKPPQDWNGNVSFNYTATDNLGGVSPVATATVTVNPVNDGTPVALADSYSTVVGTPIIITKASLLANDTQFDHAAITAVTAPSSGTLVLSGDGTYYTYTPTGVPGAPTFTYTITDDDGQTSTATVSIGVYGAGDDLSTIQESALVGGAGTSTVSGNLFSNDMGNTSLTSVTLASANTGLPGEVNIVSNTTVGNIITVVSQIGTLVVDKTTGAYTYTLNHSADNTATASNMSVEERFSYVGNNSSAALRVTVQDDMPVAANVTVEIPENTLPKYTLVLTLDCSGSMDDDVKSVADDGTVTLTTRMAMQNAAVSALISEYFSQATDISVKIVAFGTSAAIMNNGNAFTNMDAAIAAVNTLQAGTSVIDGVSIGMYTNYYDALVKAQTALGSTIDPTRSNIVYFLSDGVPARPGTATYDITTPVTSSGYATYLTLHPEINSFGVGVGSGITNVSHLNQIHNVDALGDGTRDPAIIVADVNKLEESLISTVPAAYGGNVISANSAQSVTFGADGGYVNQVSLMLDTDGNPATAEQLVTFNYNNTTDQIAWSGGFPAGSPLAGNLLTLNDSKGFDHGTLVFNFQSGDYTYFTAGLAHEGDSFSLSFVAVDKDGDTAAATQTISIVDGKPVANDDSDTLAALNQYLEGNVVTGIGTDGGIALGSQLTNFTPQASGVDNAADNAQVTSIVFKGVTYNLTVDSSGSNSGGSYTISGGTLSWAHASNGSQLEFSENGYYKFTPPTADVPTTSPLLPAAVLPLLQVSNSAVTESASTTYAQFTVSLSAASSTDTTVSLALATGGTTGTGNASSGTDYSATLQYSIDGGTNWVTGAAATIAAGQTSLLARTQIANNATGEPTENFRLVATRTAGSTANATATGYAVITDDDAGATTIARASITDVTIDENAGTATFSISLSSNPGGNVSVTWATGDGSAVAGSDYTASGTTTANFTTANWATPKIITVPILNDAVLEGTEAFFVYLTATSRSDRAIIGDGTGVATLQNIGGTPPAPIVLLETDPALVPANGITLQGILPNSSVPGSAPVVYTTGATGGAGVTNDANDRLEDLETLVINFDASMHPQGVQNLRFEITSGGTNDAVTYTFYHIDGHELGQYTVAGNGWITMPAEYSSISRVTMLADTDTTVRIHAVSFNDVSNDLAAPAVAPEIIQYTLTDSDGDTSTASLTLNITTNTLAGDDAANTLTGTAANDAIHGLGGDDTITGGAGHDIIQGGDGNDIIDGGADDDTITGGAGNDTLTGGTGSDTLRGQEGDDSLGGGAGNDRLEGGSGNDILVGGDGDDVLIGGPGTDTLTGGLGADVFKWELADRGVKGNPATDTVTDFDPAAAVSGGDVLDLRDLLSSESHTAGSTGNLGSYLHFEQSGSDTVVHISSTGGFSGGFVSNQEDHSILLQGVDLIGSFSTDQQIIQDLLNKGKLITD